MLLDEEGYCEIVKQLGEQYLSFTCAIFPRKPMNYGDVQEICVEISCPLVAKRLFGNDKMEYYINDAEIGVDFPQCDFTIYNSLHLIRNFLLDIIQYKSGEYVHGKAYILLNLCQRVQELLCERNLNEEETEKVLIRYCGQGLIDEVFANCENIKDNIIAKAKMTQQMMIEMNSKKLFWELMEISRKHFANLDEEIVEWVNNGELLQNDMQEFLCYLRKTYPQFTERFLMYCLFTNWMAIEPNEWGKDFVTRIVEHMLIQIYAMALFKKNRNITLDDYAVLIASFDRMRMYENEYVITEINSIIEKMSKDSGVCLLLLLIA